ncbi:MAG: Ribosomal RNA small subunit methyltransferase I [Alphaproteobacteria bacterium MarineAlpha5_Bin5]|nr:MAG: Ribosomal RNA small subunit methyltransferase I [Alphaproteobacteria bacterium MarineAlpha5_Bin5]PPR52737.1 MAG: Ribosomal RNA small subunit methyltransferase I [Alphaproteobacteria bacterium MarineAlpha5_Bin4]
MFVTAVPGPSALLPALQLSTIPFNEFQFLGFAPKTTKSLNEFLIKVSNSKTTSVFFVSSHRIEKCIKTAIDILKNRKIAVCKEITKINENTFIGLPVEVLQKIEKTQKGKMGEFVVVVEKSPKQSKAKEIFNKEIEGQIVKLLEKFSLTDVVEIVHKISYIAKKEIYKKALKLKK